MKIRRRLELSFLIILLMFALNLGVHFVGNYKRGAAVDELRTAIARQNITATLQQQVSQLKKQIALMSEVTAPDAQSTGLNEDELSGLRQQLQKIGAETTNLVALSHSAAPLVQFGRQCAELRDSWLIFFENFGRNQARAIEELVARGDPRSDAVLSDLSRLQAAEKIRVEEASDDYNRVAAFTERLTLVLFGLTTIAALFVAYSVSRYLTNGLTRLTRGAELIGSLTFNKRIDIDTRDELGDLARAYNSMADNLHTARERILQGQAELEARNKELEKQRGLSESLLLNILPPAVAKELMGTDKVQPKYFEDVTILFTDFVGFTRSSEKLAAEDLVERLHDYFTAFDQIAKRYYLEKLKTIGDSYMCVAGMPVGRRNRRVPSHPVDAVMAALEMVQAVQERERPDADVRWAVRVGLHTGPVVAGVVGINKFAFDIWGDSVNFASRMESSGAPNRVNISERTYTRVKDFFVCEPRGRVMTKDKREVEMFFVNGLLPALMAGESEGVAPASFTRRYRVYFQKEPPAFPALIAATGTLAAEKPAGS